MKTTKSVFQKEVDVFKLCNEIETEIGIKLMATNKNDTVQGYVNYDHETNELEIHLYNNDEDANDEHKTTFRKPTLTVEQQQKLTDCCNNHVK